MSKHIENLDFKIFFFNFPVNLLQALRKPNEPISQKSLCKSLRETGGLRIFPLNRENDRDLD